MLQPKHAVESFAGDEKTSGRVVNVRVGVEPPLFLSERRTIVESYFISGIRQSLKPAILFSDKYLSNSAHVMFGSSSCIHISEVDGHGATEAEVNRPISLAGGRGIVFSRPIKIGANVASEHIEVRGIFLL